MKRIYTYTITAEYIGCKISEFLRNAGYSRQSLTFLRHAAYDSIFIDGMPFHMNQRLEHAGQMLAVIVIEDTPSPKIPPVELPLDIIYEDADLMVVNKPARMPIHPSMKNYYNSLGNAVMYHMLHIDPAVNDMANGAFVYRCINRLDRDTTGLTIIAKNGIVAGMLYEQLKSRAIKRTYTAIVEDQNPWPENADSSPSVESANPIAESPNLPHGTIALPLGRKPGSTVERCVDTAGGEYAVTRYHVIRRDSASHTAVVECQLDTGRTHQIRVHMAAIGHPLIGDFLYNPDNRQMDRQALHAGRLEFTHPITKEELLFTAALPEDMSSFIS